MWQCLGEYNLHISSYYMNIDELGRFVVSLFIEHLIPMGCGL